MSESGELSNLQTVMMSYWTGDYFLEPALADGTFHVCDGEPLHDAITALVANWRAEDDEANSSVTYYKEQ